MRRGEIWWVDLGQPYGSEPGFTRPVLIVQADPFNISAIATVIVASITSNLDLSDAPGNVYLYAEESGLPKDSVIKVSQTATIDKKRLSRKVGFVTAATLQSVEEGLRLVMGL